MAEINVGQISEALNNKADLDLHNTQPLIGDYVVEWQAPIAENNYTWYRLYKSGWIEQGGSIEQTSGTAVTITLPKQMLNTRYTVLAQQWNSGTQVGLVLSKTTSSFVFGGGSVGRDGWYVSGMAAQS